MKLEPPFPRCKHGPRAPEHPPGSPTRRPAARRQGSPPRVASPASLGTQCQASEHLLSPTDLETPSEGLREPASRTPKHAERCHVLSSYSAPQAVETGEKQLEKEQVSCCAAAALGVHVRTAWTWQRQQAVLQTPRARLCTHSGAALGPAGPETASSPPHAREAHVKGNLRSWALRHEQNLAQRGASLLGVGVFNSGLGKMLNEGLRALTLQPP